MLERESAGVNVDLPYFLGLGESLLDLQEISFRPRNCTIIVKAMFTDQISTNWPIF